MRVAVASGFFAGPRGPSQLRKDILQIGRDRLNSLSFGAHREQFLFEVEVKRKRSGQVKRKLVLIGSLNFLYGSGQGQDFEMKLNRFRALFLGRASRFIRHDQDLCLQE